MQAAPSTRESGTTATQPICFVTSSDEKVKEASLVFPFPLKRMNMELIEVQSTDLETVVRHKAMQAWQTVQAPVFVEDTSLRFMAWRNLPGPFIKHFIQNLGLLGIVDALSPAKAVAEPAYSRMSNAARCRCIGVNPRALCAARHGRPGDGAHKDAERVIE